MMKRILLLMFMLILLSSFTSAQHELAYYPFESNLNDIVGFIANMTGTIDEYVQGVVGNAVNLTGINAILNGTDVQNISNISTIDLWINTTDLTGVNSILDFGDDLAGDSDFYLNMEVATDGTVDTFYYINSVLQFNLGATCTAVHIREGEWHNIIFKYNTTAVAIHFDGNPETNCTTDETITKMDTNFKVIAFGGKRADLEFLMGTMDNIRIVNWEYTTEEIIAAYNNGAGKDYSAEEEAAAATEAPTIVAPSPADNANNNTNVTLNVSHSTLANDVNYYLYWGTANPLTETDLYLLNVTRTEEEHRTFTTNVSIDGIYRWKWKVQNVTDGVMSINTTVRTWTLDTTTPTISVFHSAENTTFKIDNSTIISNYLTNLTINFSFYDLNLYQTLINISNSSGQSVFSIANTTISGTTANYSQMVNITTWAVGNYTIQLVGTDEHTTNLIDDYEVKTGLSYFRYTTPEGNVIKITSDTLPLTKDTTKLKNRYTFDFNYLFQKDTYKFRIESYNKIDYIEDSDYKAHFVIMGSNGRGNWIDFDNPNLNSKDYKVTKIDDYIYEVEITANGMKNFVFNSLGGLNKVEEHYAFRVGGVLDIWVFDEENYPTQVNATATIGTQFAHTLAGTSAARLVNVTRETTIVTLNASGFGTEEKTISITNPYHNFSFNMSPVLATKLYFYDEESEALIGGETFSVYLERTGFSNTYSATTNPYTITGLGAGIYKLKASSTNYPERQYLNLNVSDIATTNLNIYLINSTDGAEKTFSIFSETLSPLEDVFVVFTRIINGTATVIAEEESDFAGQVKLYLDSNTEYTINFSKTNYEDKIISLEPTESEYVITMISSVGIYNQSVYEGIRYSFEPSNTVLNNNTKYNFTFTLNSSVWDISNCTLKLYNDTLLINESSSYTSYSCFISIERDTSDMTTIVSEAIYELNNQYEFTVTQQYEVIYTYEGEFSLKNFLDDLSDFSMAGFDSFGRMILAFIVIFVILAMASMKISFEHKEVPIFIFWALVGFFSYVNWFYLDIAVPEVLGLKKYFIFYLVSLVGGAFIWNKMRQ